VVEAEFERYYSSTRRIAAVRAVAIVTLYGLPQDTRADLEQEALLELWRKLPLYDPSRASWRTYAERVAANRLVSLMRNRHLSAYGHRGDLPLDNIERVAPPFACGIEWREDVLRVLFGMARMDRAVAESLMVYPAAQTAVRLGVSRAAVYRAIRRLRTAFTAAGLSPLRHE